MVGMMYCGDYEGVHQGNIGWVVAEIRLNPWFGNRFSDLASRYSDLTKYIARTSIGVVYYWNVLLEYWSVMTLPSHTCASPPYPCSCHKYVGDVE